jgi:DNA polymerase-3 subunit epsilon
MPRTTASTASHQKSDPRTPSAGAPFVAIDFETANASPDSACAVGLVRVDGDRVVARHHRLIRPPSTHFEFTWVHGISWRDVANEPTFAEVWRDLVSLLDGAAFLAAHNASFDRNVLLACCGRYGLKPPAMDFLCTVRLARKTWALENYKLPTVSAHLEIPLDHHRADSDAEACALIVVGARRVAAQREGGIVAPGGGRPGR